MGIYIKNWSAADWIELLKLARIGANNSMIGEFSEVEEVPQHGRLGDLDTAVVILERLRDHCGNEDMAYALNWAANTIKDLPTIIPTED